MSRKVTTRALVKGISADAKKVEVKMHLDASDVGACEDLMGLRGRIVKMTVEEEQESIDFGDCDD